MADFDATVFGDYAAEEAPVEQESATEEHAQEAQPYQEAAEEGEAQAVPDGDREETGSGDESDEQKTEGPTPQQLAEYTKALYGYKDEDIVIDDKGQVNVVMPINGRKRLVPVQDIPKGFNLNQAGYEKLNEGKRMQKQWGQFMESLKENPDNLWKLTDHLGIDKYTLMEKGLRARVDELEMPEEERKVKEAEAKLRALEERQRELDKQDEERKIQAEVEVQRNQIEADLTQAMSKHGFMESPKDQKSAILMGALGKMQIANQLGQEMSADQAVAEAKADLQNWIWNGLAEIRGDQAYKFLPKHILDGIRKADMDRLKAPPTSGQLDMPVQLEEYRTEEAAPRKSQGKMKLNDFFSDLGF